ncbi:hypothetical protein MMC17_003353 [Xylographa soralifera]|nr:hypothetical protein [Xylographa soralifera]
MKVNYGRKRTNLASVFSRFQDSHSPVKTKSDQEASDEQKPSIEDHAQQIPSINSNTNTTDHTRLDADDENSIDELADAMPEDSTMKGQKSCTRRDVLPSEFSKSGSGMNLSEIRNKPLPRIPKHQSSQAFLDGPQHLYDDAYEALEPNNTNHQITVDDTENTTESRSFHPVCHSFYTSGNTDTLSSPGTGEAECLGYEEVASYAIPVTANAIHLGNTLPSLVQHNDVEGPKLQAAEPQVKHKEAKHLFKVPGFQKGREVLGRAKKAISERLSSSASSKVNLKWHKASHDKYAPQSPNPAKAVDEKYQMNDNDANLHRLNRRLAEGANLSNPKIKALTGDGLVVRKPFPAHHGMKSPAHWSDSFEDPFSDELLSSSQLIVPINKLSLYNTREARQFSDQLSGLRQHADIGFFSSSPIGFSTPRFRLEPEVNTSGKKRLSVVPASEPSLLDLNFDEPSEDEMSKLPKLPKLKFNMNDLSLKRKHAMVDQGFEQTPPTKILKTELMQLAINMEMLGRNGGPLGVRDQNLRLIRTPVPLETGGEPHIVQVPSGRERSVSVGSVQSIEVAPNAKRSSIPVSFKSARSSQRQSTIPALVGTIQDDSLSADELQMD